MGGYFAAFFICGLARGSDTKNCCRVEHTGGVKTQYTTQGQAEAM